MVFGSPETAAEGAGRALKGKVLVVGRDAKVDSLFALLLSPADFLEGSLHKFIIFQAINNLKYLPNQRYLIVPSFLCD